MLYLIKADRQKEHLVSKTNAGDLKLALIYSDVYVTKKKYV